MPNTPIFGWPYQALTDAPDGAALGEDLALAIEATLLGGGFSLQVGAISELTSDSSGFTNAAETPIQSLTVPVVIGRTYKIWWSAHWASSVDDDKIRWFIRPDTISGAPLNSGYAWAFAIGGNLGNTQTVVAKYTADATEDKTFILSAIRIEGSGTCRADAASDRPCLAWVELWHL